MKEVKVTVIESNCNRMKLGDYFIVKGDKVHAPMEQGICFYSLSALSTFLPLWQMDKDKNEHYVKNFTTIHCPMNYVTYKAEQIETEQEKNSCGE